MERDRESDTGSMPEEDRAHEPAHYYVDSGIEERHGRVPLWLWVVTAALLVWGVYYLAANWSPPA